MPMPFQPPAECSQQRHAHRFVSAAIAVAALLYPPCEARVFFVGSNPAMTVFAYPQDILLMPKDFAFYYTVYQRHPWWGDIDDIELKPGTTYLLTGESVGVEGSDDYFAHESNVYHWKNICGFLKTLSPRAKLRFDLQYILTPFRSRAEGAMTDAAGTNHLSFDYSEKHAAHDVYLTAYWGYKPRTIPWGLKLGFGFNTATEPRLEWTINENDTLYEGERHAWAWSTLQGGHLFDDYEGHERARYQDSYTTGSLYQMDLQGAATLPRLKLGGRLRYKFGSLDQFEWQADTSAVVADPTIRYEMTGDYVNAVAKEISEKTIRLYGNVNWIKHDKFRFSTLVLSRYTVADSTGVIPANSSIGSGVVERARNFVLQINPNINVYPWDNKFTFVDLALLCNYSHLQFDFTRPYSVGGGQVDSYVNTRVSLGEDYAWHDYSYARQNFFEIALDANPTFPVFGNRTRSVAMSLNLLFWLRFKWLYKYYGTNDVGSSDVTFNVDHVRKNFEREIWLNSVLNIIYRREPYMLRLMFGQPLTYSLSPVTRVYDSNGELLSEVEHENMWVSQSGAQVGLFISTTLENLFRRRSRSLDTAP